MEAKLIEFVKKHPVLYEKQYRSLKYHEDKQARWQEISRILRKEPTVVRLKWKHLRDTYLRSYKQKIKKGDDGDILSTKTWQYYNAMTFLNNTFEDEMDFQEKLIDLVRKHEYLYNLESPSYKDASKKEEAWNKIGQEMRQPSDVCKRKWKGLRDSYKRVKNINSQKSEAEVTDKKKPWKYEEHMKFLDGVQCSRNNMIFKTEETFYDDETDAAINTLNQQDQQQFDVSIYNEQAVSNEGDFEIENFDLNDYVKKIDTPAKPVNSTTTTTNITLNANNNSTQDEHVRKKKYDKEALIQEACHEMTSMLQNAKKHFTPPSSNQVFFNSMALQVEEAQLPALTQMRLQQRILEMVTVEIVNHQQSTMHQL